MRENTNLRFGVELELVVRPKPDAIDLMEDNFQYIDSEEAHRNDMSGKRDENRRRIVAFLREYFRLDSFEADVNDEGERDYTRWIVEEDPSIQEDVGPNYGIEVVSPIQDANNIKRWKETFDMIWAGIEKYFDIVTEPRHMCSTHVHISPAGGYSIDQARRVAKGVILFQNSIAEMTSAANQTNSEYAVMPDFPNELLSRVDGMDRGQLVDAMVPLIAGLAERRFVAWNFMPLDDQDPRGTIEFRQAPHATTAKDVKRWILFTISFIEICLHVDFDIVQRVCSREKTGLLMELAKLGARSIALNANLLHGTRLEDISPL